MINFCDHLYWKFTRYIFQSIFTKINFFFSSLFRKEKNVPFYSVIPVLLLLLFEIFIRHLTGSTLYYFQYAHEQCALFVHIFCYHKCEKENVISRNWIEFKTIHAIFPTSFRTALLKTSFKLGQNFGKRKIIILILDLMTRVKFEPQSSKIWIIRQLNERD